MGHGTRLEPRIPQTPYCDPQSTYRYPVHSIWSGLLWTGGATLPTETPCNYKRDRVPGDGPHTGTRFTPFDPVYYERREPHYKQKHPESRTTYDSVFGKRVLTYWENRGTPDYCQMNGFIEGIENYIYLERRKPHLSENVWFSIGTINPSMWL